MAGAKTGKLFTDNGSQAVELPKEFRLAGSEVRVSRDGRRVILEPIVRDPADAQSVFAEIDRLLREHAFPGPEAGEGKPVSPDPRRFFDA